MPEAIETETTTSTTEQPAATETTTEQTPAVEAQATETQASETPAADEGRERLEASVREKLAALRPDGDEDEESAEQEETPAAEESTSETTATKEAAAAVTPAAPTLPAAHVRSLKAYGLSDEEIAKTDPVVAATLHARRNQEITRWAEEGRKAKQPAQTTQQAPAAAVPTPPVQPQQKKLDIAALKQQYGDEPLIAALEQQEAELTQFRQFRQQWEAQSQQQQLETLSRQVDAFFQGKELEPYRETYGTTSNTLTPEQAGKREEVLRLADAIFGGAKLNGQQLSVEQALQFAFDSVSAPAAKQAARQEITKQLQARGKGVSLKPGTRSNPPKAKTRADLERNVRAGLKKAFGS